MKSSGKILAPLVITAALLFAVFALMQAIAEVRFLELGRKLTEITGKREEFRNLGILKRLQLNQQAVWNLSEEKKFAEERNLAIVMATVPDQTRNGASESIGLGAVNLINSTLGLPQVHLSKPSREEKIIETAFFYEKQRQFGRAHAVYEVLMSSKLPAAWRDYVLIHKGFCASMLGNYAAGISDLETLLRESKDPVNIRLAGNMLNIIKAQADKALRVKSNADAYEKAEYFHSIGAYAEAARIIGDIPATRRDARLLFIYGRALEETGNPEAAANNYRTAIKKDTLSPQAVQANRRLYALGAYYGQGKSLREEAKTNSKTLVGDEKFFRDAAPSEVLLDSLESDLRRESENAAVFEKEKSEPAVAALPAVVTVPASAPEELKPERKPPRNIPAPITAVAVPPVATPAEVFTNLRNPAAARRAEKFSRAEKKNLLIKQYPEIDRLLTSDGNEFFGIIYAENTEKIYIFTVVGNLAVNKEDLTERTKTPIQTIMQ